MDRDERLERLDLVGKDRLPAAKQDTSAPGPSISLTIERYTGGDIHFHTRPEGGRRLVVPCVDDTAPHMLPYNRRVYQSSRTRCQSERISIRFRKEQRFAAGTYVSAQFPLSQVLVLAPVQSPFQKAPSRRSLTDTGSLPDIDGQIGLRPVRLALFVRSSTIVRGCPAYRLMVAAIDGCEREFRGREAPAGTEFNSET